MLIIIRLKYVCVQVTDNIYTRPFNYILPFFREESLQAFRDHFWKECFDKIFARPDPTEAAHAFLSRPDYVPPDGATFVQYLIESHP